MKVRTIVLCVAVSFLTMGLVTACFAQAKVLGNDARITLVLPVAMLERTGQKEAIRVTPGMTIMEGDKITTMKGSRLEITFSGSTVIRMDENSSLLIESIRGAKVKTRVLPSPGGADRAKVWGKILKKEEGRSLDVKTPIALTGVEGTAFRIDLLSDSTTTVRVYDGLVKVTPVVVEGESPDTSWAQEKVRQPRQIAGPGQVSGPRQVTLSEYMVILKALEEVTLSGDTLRQKQVPHTFDAGADSLNEWVKWNLERDSR